MQRSWRDKFASHIRERGREYYLTGCVKDLSQDKYGYSAVVTGTEDYEVDIYIENGELVNMACSCPYAERGLNCKHMAAVLMEIDNGTPISTDEAKKTIVELVHSISEEKLRSFVLEIAKKDDAFANQLIARFSSQIDTNQLKMMELEIDSIIDNYSDRHGYIEYGETSAFELEMEHFLDNNVEPMIEGGHYMSAVELLCYFYQRIDTLDIDDSNGTTTILADACHNQWQDILSLCSEDEEKAIFERLKKLHKQCEMDYIQDHLWEFIVEAFQGEAAVNELLTIVDEEISHLNRSDYHFQTVFSQRISLMRRKGVSLDEINAYRSRFRQEPFVRQMELREAMEQNRLKDAIALCLESREMDRSNEREVESYTKRLIKLYQENGQQKQYETELFRYIFAYPQYNLDYIKQAKAVLAPEQWIEMRQKLLASQNQRSIHMRLMELEQMYEELFEAVKQENSFWTLRQYEEVLKPHYPIPIRNMWVHYIEEAAESTGSRSSYQELMQYMKKLKEYPDGDYLTKEIAANWRIEYKRRKAMMDELNKAGF